MCGLLLGSQWPAQLPQLNRATASGGRQKRNTATSSRSAALQPKTTLPKEPFCSVFKLNIWTLCVLFSNGQPIAFGNRFFEVKVKQGKSAE